MRKALGPGALGGPGGSRWGGRWEGGSGMGKTCEPKAFSFQCMTKFTTNKKKEKKKKERKKEKDARSCHQEDKGHQVFTLYRRMIHGPTLTTKQNGHMCRTQPHRITFSRMKDLFVP